MKFTIQTELMKDVVARAIKGAGNNKLIPITSMMCIELKNGDLTVITTDATNYLYIKEQHVAGDDFYVVVDANQFAKLVSKMTCENITMTVDEKLYTMKVCRAVLNGVVLHSQKYSAYLVLVQLIFLHRLRLIESLCW